MIESSDRVLQFKADVSEMRLADPALARDRTLLRLAVALLVIGPLLGVVGYVLSHGTTNPLQQRDAIVVALIGVSSAVVGGALFVRYSMAGFLRFWLARLIYEQKAQTDQVVGALHGDGRGSTMPAPSSTTDPTPAAVTVEQGAGATRSP